MQVHAQHHSGAYLSGLRELHVTAAPPPDARVTG